MARMSPDLPSPAPVTWASLSSVFGPPTPERWDYFGDKANGLPSTDRTQAAYSLSGGSVGATARPTIVSGKLTSAVAAPAAGYATLPLTASVRRIGGKFSFGSGVGATGSAVLCTFASDIAGSFPTIPNSPCHLAITPTGWNYSVWTSNTITTVAFGTFATALAQDGTEYFAEINIDKPNSKAYVSLPDGTTTVASHASIGAHTAAYATFETYQSGATDPIAAWSNIWADSKLSDRLVVAKGLSVMPASPTVVQYAPGTNGDVAVPAAEATVDATNLTITVILPASMTGILVEMTAYIDCTVAGQMLWGYREGGTSYGMQTVMNMVGKQQVSYVHKRTGVGAGTSHTFVWRHWMVAGTATFKIDGPNGYQPCMKITPIP